MTDLKKYICLNCMETFSEPTRIRDSEGDYRWLSPCCRDSYTVAMECASCGGTIPVGSDLHGRCRKCAEAVVSKLQYLLYNEFTEAEREVLNDAFDGVSLTDPDEAKVVVP